MNVLKNKRLRSVFFIFCLSALANSEPLTSDNFVATGAQNSVVLVAVNWGRQWSCGSYENAQLMKLGFINLATKGAITLESPSKLRVKSEFVDYGYIVEPGEYAFSEYSIKVAKSATDVSYLSANQDRLLPDNSPKGGTFSVKPGEVAYVGHFALDCYEEPIPWRYYPEGVDGFAAYTDSVKKKFAYLKASDISFTILNTTLFGTPYKLP